MVLLGLYEGSIVSCKVVEDLPVLETVYVTATNQKDWEMLVKFHDLYFTAHIVDYRSFIYHVIFLKLNRRHQAIVYKTLSWIKQK